MLFLIILAIPVVAFFTIYFNLKHHFNYFKRYNVNHVEPALLFGNLKDLFLSTKDPVQWMNSLYHSKKAKHQPYIGFFGFHKPGLFIRDPELIKHICIKDSLHFKSRDSNIEIIELSSSKPNFSSDTIKQFFSIFDEVSTTFF